MQQIRLFMQLHKSLAQNYFNLIEQIFESEGYALSTVPLDEQNDLYEISLYCFDKNESEIIHQLEKVAKNLSITPNIQKEILPDIDWVQHSLKGLKPVETNNFFIFGSHDKHLIKPNKINIEIEANQAFGTGHHNTTLGCLILLEKYLTKNIKNILDLGTGTGILSMAIAMQQVKQNILPSIIASDIDPTAIRIATDNFALNKVSKYIKPLIAEGLDDKQILEQSPFDLIVANILAKPLIELAKNIKNVVHNNSLVILSGILNKQSDEVIAAYKKHNFKIVEILQKEEWVALILSLI